MVVGPFLRGAREFHQGWREHSRKLHCRLVFGCLQALRYRDRGLKVWVRNPAVVVALCEDLLKKHLRRSQTVAGLRRVIHVVCHSPDAGAPGNS
jgi:hypothetical protein